MKKEREILRKQLEILSKDSERAMPDEISDHSKAMSEIYKALAYTHPIIVFVIGCILVYGLFGFFEEFINFFRGHGR